VTPGQTLCSMTLMARVANNVFNDMSMLGLVAYHTALGQQYDAVLSSHLAL
jgi:hypothetical protein